MSERPDMRVVNQKIVEEFRANGGRLEQNGVPLVVLTTKGAKTGNPHTTPVVVGEDGDRLVVVGSMGGLPDHPQWYKNMVANPTVTVEWDGETYQATATTVPVGPERDRLVPIITGVLPQFPRYEEKARATRTIPIVVLDRLP